MAKKRTGWSEWERQQDEIWKNVGDTYTKAQLDQIQLPDFLRKKEEVKPEPTVTVEPMPNTRGIGVENGFLRPKVTTDPIGNKTYGWEFGGKAYEQLQQGIGGNGNFIDSILNGAGNKSTYHKSGAVGQLGAGMQTGTEGTRSIIDNLLKPQKDGGIKRYETAPAILNTKTSQLNTLRKKLQQAEDQGNLYEASRLDNEIYELEKQIEQENKQKAQPAKQSGIRQTGSGKVTPLFDMAREQKERKPGTYNNNTVLDPNDPTGRFGKGNIDLNNRKTVRNADGSISTEESFSVNIDGMEVLLPTIINGKRVSEDEAIEHYKKTGQHLGKFNTVEEANAYAEQLHNRQDWYYNQGNAAAKKGPAKTFMDEYWEKHPEERAQWLYQAGQDVTKAQKARQEYLQDLAQRTQEAMNRLQAAGVNPATGWLGQTTDEYTTAMTYANAKQDLATIEEAKKAGLFNNSGDIAMMNQTGRSAARREARNYQAVIEWSKGRNEERLDDLIEEYNNWMDPESRTAEDAYQAYKAGLKEGEQAKSFVTFKTEKINDLLAKQEKIGRKIESQGLRLSTEQKRLDQIEHYNELDERYNELMDPKLREIKTEQLTEELNRLQAQFAEQEAAGNQYEATKTDAQIYEIEKQIERMQRYGNASGYEPQQEETAYDKGDKNLSVLDTMETSVDNVYSFLSGGTVYQNFTNTVGDENNFYISKAYNGAMFMKPNEKEYFMGLYRQAIDEGRQPTEAKAFLDAMQPFLNQRSRDYEQIQNRMLARTMPVTSSVLDVGAAVLSPALAVGTAIGQMTGAEWAKDPYSNAFALARMQNDTEEMIASDLGEVGGFFYKSGMSLAKNLARNLIAGGFGDAASAVSLTQFFGENYYSTYQKKLEESGDAGKAGLYALVDSCISTFFEVASVEKFFSDPTDLAMYVLKNTGAEVSEEFFEGTLGPFIQRMVFGESEWDIRQGQILDAGGYYDDNGKWVMATDTDNRAKEQAMKEWAWSTLESMGSAALTSGSSAIYGAGVNISRNNKANKITGNKVMNFGEENNQKKKPGIALTFGQGQNILSVLDAASKMGPETKSAALAGKMLAQIDAGQENQITEKEVGELYRNVLSETDEQIATTVKNALEEDVEKAMQAAGTKNIGNLPEIVTKAIAGEKLSAKEKFMLWRSHEAKELARKYGIAAQLGLVADEETAATMNRIDEETKSLRETQDELLKMGGYQSEQAEQENAAEEESSRFLASEEEIAEAEEAEKEASYRPKGQKQLPQRFEGTAGETAGQEEEQEKESSYRPKGQKQLPQRFEETQDREEAQTGEKETSFRPKGEKQLPQRFEETAGEAAGQEEEQEKESSYRPKGEKKLPERHEEKGTIATILGENDQREAGYRPKGEKQLPQRYEETAGSTTGAQEEQTPETSYRPKGEKMLPQRMEETAGTTAQETETEAQGQEVSYRPRGEKQLPQRHEETQGTTAQETEEAQGQETSYRPRGEKMMPQRYEEEAQTAAQAEEEEAAPATERKQMPPEKRARVITNGKYAFVNDVETRIVKDADGGNTAQVMVTVEDADGNTETVDIADVKAATPAEAAVLDYISRNGTNVAGNRYVTAMLGAARQAKTPNARRLVRDMIGIRTAVYTESGEENKAANVPEEIRNELIEAAREDYQNDEENRTATQRTINPGQGRTVFKGVYFGTNAYKAAIKSLNKTLRNEAEAIGQIAKEYGFDVELYYDPKDTANQGSFSTAGGIRINLAGTSNDEGAHRSALATFAHEVTHWLEANSPQAYKDFRTMVLRNLRNRGYRIDNEIERTIGTYMHYGQQIDMAGAVAELVAKGSEEVLLSDAFINDLRQKDQTLFGQIRNAVTELIGRIRNLAASTRSSSSRYAKAMNNIAEELGKKWLAAYEEAARTQAKTGQAGNRKNSFKEQETDNKQVEINEEGKYNNNNKEKEVTGDDERRAERIRERAGTLSRRNGWAFGGRAALSIVRGDYSGIVAKGRPGYELFSAAINGSEVKSKKGDPIIWYHGSGNQFNQFKEQKNKNYPGSVGYYFTSSAQIADYYTEGKKGKYIYPVGVYSKANISFSAKEFNDNYKIQNNALRVIEAINRITNKIELDEDALNRLNKFLNNEIKNNTISKTTAGKIFDAFVQYGHIDTVTVKGAVWETGETNDQLVVFDSKNIIPATTEFWNEMENKENDSKTQFSMQEPVEQNAAGLIAVHNIEEEQLLRTIQLGGFPMPSIAIIKDDYAHNRYGAISVVFKPGTIDPKALKANKVYGGDAWTATYPSIEYKVNSKELEKIQDRILKLIPKELSSGRVDLYKENLEKSLNSNRGDAVKTVKDNLALKAAYLEEKGEKINYPTKERKIASGFDNDQVLYVIDKIGAEELNRAYEYGYSYIDEHPELKERIRTALNEQWKEKIKGKVSNLKLLEKDLYDEGNFGFGKINNLLQGVYTYTLNGIKQELDEYALKDQLNEQIDDEAYEAWLRDLFSNIIEKKGIRNNKNYYTDSGNPRSWEALHEEETLENVVKVMKAELDKGSNAFFNQSAMLALGTRDFKTLDEIRAHKNQLQHISDEELSAAKQNIVEEFGKLMDEMYDRRERNIFIARDRALEAMVEAVRKSKTPAGIMRELRQWHGLNLTEDIGQRIADLLEEIANLPTEYFEAKPARAVHFDEVEKIIVPTTASQELMDAMDEIGLPYETYDGTDEDRLRALNNQKDAKFSIRDQADVDAMLWMESVPEWSLGTEAEKELQRQYKGLRMKAQLRMEDIRKWENEIKRLEEIPEAQRDKDTKRKIEAYKIRVKNSRAILEQTQERIAKVTGSEGYVQLMHQQSKVLNDFIYGRTTEEVRDAVNRLQDSAEAIGQEIEENRKAIERLQKTDAVQRIMKIMGATTADRAAMRLKKKYNSTWTAKEIQGLLEPIMAKLSAGESFDEEIQQLAEVLVNNNRENRYEGLENLRGLTITVDRAQIREMKAKNTSLKEYRARLAGTGIKIKAGDTNTLDQDIEDLRAEYPEIPDVKGNNLDALDRFVDWAVSLKEQETGENIEFYHEKIAEAMADVMREAAAAASNSGLYIPSDAKARAQISALTEFIRALETRAANAEGTLEKIAERMEKLRAESGQAAGMVSVLSSDISQAMEYYDRTAKAAFMGAKRERNNAIVEQLKSKQAQQILKINEEWRELIERDKEAASTAVDIQRERGKINTAVKRMYALLKNQKGLTKNIPEHMQGLARWIIEQFVGNDVKDEAGFGGRRILRADQGQLREATRLLDAWRKQDGDFKMADILGMIEEDGVYNAVNNDMLDIIRGIEEWNGEIRGKNKLDTMQQRRQIIRSVADAVGEIYTMIQRQREISIRDRQINVEDQAYKIQQEADGKRHKEWTGKVGGAIQAMSKLIVSGNMTPEYYFRMLGNAGLNDIWDGYHDAENRNGLELAKAKARLAEIAEKHGYQNWDTKQTIRVDIGGEPVEMTLGQMMSLWATWKRENTLGPEMSEHLAKGGFYAEQDLRQGILGRAEVQKRARRVNEADMARIGALLSEEQKAYIDEVVGYMSNEMSQLGNEASMKAYGIKMYKEKYYFPFQIWNGVKNLKSNDAGNGASANQAFHPSFSKGRLHGAQNALIIGDFTDVATDHIVGMINYATMGLANENLQKVMNTQVQEGQNRDEATKRNMWTVLEEAYGQEAAQYLRTLKTQLEGGATRAERTVYDKMLSMFRKNAVAGSLSVAFQQPLSYIRAATMINSKYLSAALLKEYWKGSYEEMMQHSGVAVIKDMGRFDMNAGQTAREYITPEGKKGKFRKGYEGAAELATMLPGKMDTWTWTRMWVAVKAEQHALHPEMDMKSDEFLDMCGERFNDIMRRTQVYDSTLVRSENMRSQNPVLKSLTSFMAEPTLTLNVLADSVRSAMSGEKGGKMLMTKALATFGLSAVMQAVVKALFTTGRSPDDDKNFLENFLNRFISNMISEGDPANLISGFNDVITVLKGGELTDDAMNIIGKFVSAYDKGKKMIAGKGSGDWWRDIEDSAGQIVQLFTNIPAKNVSRDLRAMFNWFIGRPYAQRETNANIIRYGAREAIINADNMLGVVLKAAGVKTTNDAYYQEAYEAAKRGDEETKNSVIDYLLTGRGVKDEKTIIGKMNTLARGDESLSAEERIDFLTENGYTKIVDFIKELYGAGELTRKEAEEQYRKVKPKATDKNVMETFDELEYKAEHEDADSYSNYTPMYDAMEAGDRQAAATQRSKMKQAGYTDDDINEQMRKKIKGEYLAGTINRETAEKRLQNFAGMNAEEARNTVNNAVKDSIVDAFTLGTINRATAEKRLQKEAGVDAETAWWTVDRAEYKKAGGKETSEKYYRLNDVLKNRKSAAEITAAINGMLNHGMTAKQIKEYIGKKESYGYQDDYLAATGNDKVRLKQALIMAYKALGVDPDEANNIINKWK